MNKHFSELSPAALRVLDAGEDLVQRLGYSGFSYEDVAQIVGIRKASIHHHFPSKVDLVQMVAQRFTHRFREALLRIEGLHGHAVDRLAAYAELFEATYARHRRLCICGMLSAEADALPPEISSEVEKFFRVNLAWLTQVISEGQQAGGPVRAGSPALLAEAYLAALEGAMLMGRGLQTTGGPRQVGSTLVSTMLT